MDGTGRKQKTVWTGITVIWMIVIFVMSARNADLSTGDSRGTVYFLLRLFYPGFMALSHAAQSTLVLALEHPVRKCAHAAEYAVLGMLLSKRLSLEKRFILQKNESAPEEDPARREKWRLSAAALLFAALYAVTDEIHQYFVPGRSCQITDMLIDSCGAAAGITICMGIRHFLQRRMSNKRNGKKRTGQ